MCDKDSGRPRGFGFVMYADPEIADKVLKENHTIDEYIIFVYEVDVKKALTKTTRIYVGGLPLSLTEDELKEYFSSYGYVVDHCIILDRTTGRSRRFGFVSFDKEEAVEKVLSNGHMHDFVANNDGGSIEAFGGGYGGNMGSGYGGYGGYEGYGDYGRYSKFAGSYGVSPTGFYPGYCYGFWFGGAMYGAAGYEGSTYGIPA
ncbi:hypothetical protein R3W88_017488 [Solanum pinnatisectum]|uniref:RRM domain-containing protein n=1 Tax=Solanum pinnatisectum TaxID=50273 RepID=A0AAV9L3H7_9SOLN|nr:hypothetical protein R3W88_017488 [Solanum pinnatisectum]